MQQQPINLDKISELPDAIIYKIFSSLDTKTLVQSSIYSNRWRHLWKSIQTLTFNPTSPTTVDFIDRVLFLRDNNSNVHHFTFSSRHEINTSRVCTWILALIRSHIQRLDLELNLDDVFELPDSLFTSDIKILKLSKYGMFSIQLPITVASCTNIKKLELITVQFPKGNSDNKLILNCSVLESLLMMDCVLFHLEVLNISLPRLENFVFVDDFDRQSSCEINVCTPKLRSFQFRSPLFGEFSLGSLPDIVSADVDVYRMDYYGIEKHVYTQRLMKVLSKIRNVKELTLSASLVKTLTKLRTTLETFPGLFANVKCMELTSQRDDETCICLVANLLETLPQIETFIFERNKILESKEEILERLPFISNTLEEPELTKRRDGCICKVMDRLPQSEAHFWEERKATWLGSAINSDVPGEEASSPQHVFHLLKTIEIRNPQGSDDEVAIMKYLLQRGKALKKVYITATEMLPVDKKNRLIEFHGMVAELPCSSSSVSITLRS